MRTAARHPASVDFEPATSRNRTILVVAAAMLAVLFMLLGTAYVVFRYTP